MPKVNKVKPNTNSLRLIWNQFEPLAQKNKCCACVVLSVKAACAFIDKPLKCAFCLDTQVRCHAAGAGVRCLCNTYECWGKNSYKSRKNLLHSLKVVTVRVVNVA